jgi:UDP-N-acetylglucosamine:LPS N-acetylglucosamine transferase
VVIVSASMGGGHNAAAEELERRLSARGMSVRSIEFLDAPPFRIGWTVQRIYRRLLRSAPWVYDLIYRLWYLAPFLWGPLVLFVCALSRRRLVRWVTEEPSDVVVSTYPLSSLVLGHERARGRVPSPVVTFLTDFSVHPLWVHPGVDVHLAVTDHAAAAAEHLLGDPAYVSGPLVRAEFRGGGRDRTVVRRALGLDDDARVALVVAGSWGVGEVERTVEDIRDRGGFTTIIVCGKDDALRRRLTERDLGIVLGWSDRMAELMAASDVLVENAGGLTSLEAMTIGLPVITYRPIPGHGKDNALAMARASATTYAKTVAELHIALDELASPGPPRTRAIRRGMAIVKGDPSVLIGQLVDGEELDNVVELTPRALPSSGRRAVIGSSS